MNIKFSFDETNVQVGFENQFVIKDMTEDTLVKILMLKGEKGDTVSAQWGTIIGNLTDQTDLKNALNSKASASDLSTTNSNVATNTSNILALNTQVATNTSNIGINTNNIATNTAAIEDNADDIADLETQVGTNTSDIADLTTQVGTNTGDIATNTSNIGTLSNLTTTDKTSLVGAVNELNVPAKWVSVGSTAPQNGERVWFKKSVNLYNGSQDFSGTWVNSDRWATADETYNGLVVKKSRNQWNGLYKEIQLKSGKNYVFSAYVKSDVSRNVAIYLTGGTGACNPQSKQNIQITNEWQRISLVFSTTNNGLFRVRVENMTNEGAGSYTYVCGYQLQEGSTVTPYEPYVEPSINVDEEEWYNSNMSKYSTDEIKIGTWIDGKPLYRKTITIDMTTEHTTNTSLAHNVSNIAFISSIRGIMKRTSGQYIDANLYENSSYRVEVKADTTNFVYQNVGFVGTTYVTLEYTKTTD